MKRYTGDCIDVTHNASPCIYAKEGVRRLPAVFDTAKQPRIQPGQAGADSVADTSVVF